MKKNYRFFAKPTRLLLEAMQRVSSYEMITRARILYFCDEMGISWIKLDGRYKMTIHDKHKYMLACIRYGE